MESLSRILKITAKIFGGFLILWGFTFGVFGIILGIDTYIPDFKDKLLSTFICLYIIIVGFLYWIPNEKIISHKKIYLILTILPAVVLIAMVIYEVLFHGIENTFFMDLAIAWIFVMICLFLAAPLSLILYVKIRK